MDGNLLNAPVSFPNGKFIYVEILAQIRANLPKFITRTIDNLKYILSDFCVCPFDAFDKNASHFDKL